MKENSVTDPDFLRASKNYLDAVFGDGAGDKHERFLDRIDNDALREAIHRYHAFEADTGHLSLEENYLIGMCVLFAGRSHGTAAMFVKTLLHLDVPKDKILEAVARLSMWIGGLPAVEATFVAQKAIREYEENGFASLGAWFPEDR
jgi:hypothetical protein